MKKINLKGIQPVGNFVFLNKFEDQVKNVEEKKSVNGAAKGIRTIVGQFDCPNVLIKGIKDGIIWNKDEAVQCLIYCETLLIRLNNVAQQSLNKIVMPSIKQQLLEHSKLKFLWKEYTLIEK